MGRHKSSSDDSNKEKASKKRKKNSHKDSSHLEKAHIYDKTLNIPARLHSDLFYDR